jgi:hypothetical protein
MIKDGSIKYIDICLKMCVLNNHISSSAKWVGARRNAKGGEAAGGRQAWEVEPMAFVLAPRLGQVRLQ